MQIALLSLVVAGSTVWLAMDASKRDWTGNSFARNVPSWVAGSLLLWPVIFPLYVFVHRKKAPLLKPPQVVPAAAVAASEPSEQYGPSLDEVEADEPASEPVVEVIEVQAEPVVESHPEPVVEVDREPVVDAVREPVVEIEPQPLVETAPQPVVAPQAVAEPERVVEPEPVAEAERESVVEVAPVEPEPVAEPEPEPEPVAEPESALEISHPDLPVEDAPPGLSVDAFKDIKPVAFGGIAAEDTEAASPVVPEPEPIPAPVVEPEPVVEVEPLSYPVETEPTIAVEPEPDMEPAVAAAVAEPETTEEPKPKKRGFGIPNPQLKLPSFGGKGALKLPQITLPPNLQGPLSDLERKIALGSVVAIVAAAAFGYSSAPTDNAAAPPPSPPPAAASR